MQDEINDLFREVSVERFVGQEQAHIQWANDGFRQKLRIDGCSDLPSLHRTLQHHLYQGKAPDPVSLACGGHLRVTCCRDKQLRDSDTERRLKKHAQLHQFYDQIAMLKQVRSLTARLFTRQEQAQNHTQTGNVGLSVQVMVAWLDSMQETGKEPSLHALRNEEN